MRRRLNVHVLAEHANQALFVLRARDVPETDMRPSVPATATVMRRGKSGTAGSRVSKVETPASSATSSALTKLTGPTARPASTPPSTPSVSGRLSS